MQESCQPTVSDVHLNPHLQRQSHLSQLVQQMLWRWLLPSACFKPTMCSMIRPAVTVNRQGQICLTAGWQSAAASGVLVSYFRPSGKTISCCSVNVQQQMAALLLCGGGRRVIGSTVQGAPDPAYAESVFYKLQGPGSYLRGPLIVVAILKFHCTGADASCRHAARSLAGLVSGLVTGRSGQSVSV